MPSRWQRSERKRKTASRLPSPCFKLAADHKIDFRKNSRTLFWCKITMATSKYPSLIPPSLKLTALNANGNLLPVCRHYFLKWLLTSKLAFDKTQGPCPVAKSRRRSQKTPSKYYTRFGSAIWENGGQWFLKAHKPTRGPSHPQFKILQSCKQSYHLQSILCSLAVFI